MPQVTQKDLDTCFIKTMDGYEMNLVSYEYLAGMAGCSDNPGLYDTEAICMTCGVDDWRELWRWFQGQQDLYNWQCTNCLIKDANSDSCPDSWYILAR